ncbi:MAG: acyl-CoA dehydrogenase family protein [Deltaproteobacteria bacterium]|nr:acyl-CoA dehydrogenase family protein [Deltaproteobacteria bacterium]
MDMKESLELMEFRAGVRDWVKANLPPGMRDPYEYTGIEEPERVGEWYTRLGAKGWLAYRWPKEYGGSGFTPAQQIVFVDELRNCDAPIPRGFGLSMVGPLLLQFGTDWQRERFLPRIARHEELWCQGYSEPNSGSDLASLQTKAVPDEAGFVVNGQKIWTSAADRAQWIFVLVRTRWEGQPQKGISFILVDMKSPGVSIRPIRQIDGRAGFFETFFDNVRVPKENLVGALNEGWSMAKALLGHERTGTGEHVEIGALIARIKRVATRNESGGRPVLENPLFRDRLAALEMEADCLRYTRYRLMTAVMQGRAPGPEASIFKLEQSQLCQALFDLALEAMGPDSVRWYDPELDALDYDLPMQMTLTRAMSIYSGSNEIQRNIIAKQVLGLPD